MTAASYRHLHPELKRLLRDAGIRPGRNQCFGNCQRIVLAAVETPLQDRLVYHEGWLVCSANVPIKHAWLKLDDVIQDPTLNNREPEHYLESNIYTTAQIRESLVTSGLWKPVDWEQLDEVFWGTRGKRRQG